ncbi:MAG: DNA methyltransferase [Gemmataceae bacterium]
MGLINMGASSGKYETAESRWAGVGPYYAMFPVEFADHVVMKYTTSGETVLDPFAGRGTTIFSAATKMRNGMGVELNPVGWVYSQAKLNPASKCDVIERVREVGRLAARRTSKPCLPVFFSWCFSPTVRQFLLTARKYLNWRQNKVDCTLMALLLVNVHGKREASLSNQMRQTKSMSPDYAVNWWKDRKLLPPNVDPVEFMENRIKWRYARGVPVRSNSFVYLGDSIKRLRDVRRRANRLSLSPATLLLTSPPYCGITNYHYDQWLRLWLLGGEPNALARPGRYRGKFADQHKYKQLLFEVFSRTRPCLDKNEVVYVRTDHRPVTLKMTIDVLKEVFPKKRMFRYARQIEKPTQTHLFKNKVEKSSEVDILLLPTV